MEVSENVTSIEISTDKITYDKKTNVLSVKILDFMFVGIYKKSVRISTILDDIYASLGEVQFGRDEIYFLDLYSQNRIHGNTKLKNLNLVSKKAPEKKKGKKPKSKQLKAIEKEEDLEFEEEAEDEDVSSFASIIDDAKYEAEELREELLLKRDVEEKETMEEKKSKKMKKPSAPPPPPAPAGGPKAEPAERAVPTPRLAPAIPPRSPDILAGPEAPTPSTSAIKAEEAELEQPEIYEINMGLQYYSVMMEQRSYLFYVYFSHEELKIVDEEGKTVYKTTVKIVTTKKEPPVLDLKIEGEGFEVHPIFGKVEVKKDAVNPPVMIFSIMPLKSKEKKKKKRETERRFLNVYIEFEEEMISHTILSIIVQPKFFRLDIGPLHLNLSKKTAVVISFISILIAGISLVWMFFSADPSSTFMDYLGGLAPGLGSVVFIVVFLYTLLKEGVYPLKEKISAFLNFDQTGVLIK